MKLSVQRFTSESANAEQGFALGSASSHSHLHVPGSEFGASEIAGLLVVAAARELGADDADRQ